MSEFNKLPEEAAQCSAHTAAPVTSRMQQHSQDILPERGQRILSTDTKICNIYCSPRDSEGKINCHQFSAMADFCLRTLVVAGIVFRMFAPAKSAAPLGSGKMNNKWRAATTAPAVALALALAMTPAPSPSLAPAVALALALDFVLAVGSRKSNC